MTSNLGCIISVGAIGFVLAVDRGMWVGIVTVYMAAVLAAPFLCFLMQTDVETAPWPL